VQRLLHFISAIEHWVYLILALGKKVPPNISGLVHARNQERSRGDAAIKPGGPRPFVLVSLPKSSSPKSSPPSTFLDMDASSVISDLSDRGSIPKGAPITSSCGHSVTRASTNATSHLASIVKCGLSVCEARRSLGEARTKALEKKRGDVLG